MPVNEEHQWFSVDDIDEIENDIEDNEKNKDDEELYDNNNIEEDNNNEDISDDNDLEIDEILDSSNILNEVSFVSALQKVRSISKTVNFPQSRIIAFQRFCEINDLKPLRPIRDHAIRWSATFKMVECAVYLRRAIDQWTISKSIYARMILDKKEWEMIEFLVQFMH